MLPPELTPKNNTPGASFSPQHYNYSRRRELIYCRAPQQPVSVVTPQYATFGVGVCMYVCMRDHRTVILDSFSARYYRHRRSRRRACIDQCGECLKCATCSARSALPSESLRRLISGGRQPGSACQLIGPSHRRRRQTNDRPTTVQRPSNDNDDRPTTTSDVQRCLLASRNFRRRQPVDQSREQNVTENRLANVRRVLCNCLQPAQLSSAEVNVD